MLHDILGWIVDFVHHLGYPGIFIMTFLESTFAPIPSEATMIPVGYLVYQGKMDLTLAIALSIAGTVAGSLFNYWIAYAFGRRILVRFGKYFFMDEEKLRAIERFFDSHGPISIFSGRLIPGVRHFISFPAGLSMMNLRLFTLYTALGGSIWMCTLIGLGYYIGENQETLHHYVSLITKGILLFLAMLVGVYAYRRRVAGKL